MILTSSRPAVADIEAGTGWALKPEGACRGEVCVPLPGNIVGADGTVDVERFAERLGMPLVLDETTGLSVLGPSSISGRALVTAVAPDLTLPDIDGNEFQLSSLLGRKVVMVAWSPY